MSGFSKRYSAFNRFQQRHGSLGFPLAVLQKYADDQGGYLAATITYCGVAGEAILPPPLRIRVFVPTVERPMAVAILVASVVLLLAMWICLALAPRLPSVRTVTEPLVGEAGEVEPAAVRSA